MSLPNPSRTDLPLSSMDRRPPLAVSPRRLRPRRPPPGAFAYSAQGKPGNSKKRQPSNRLAMSVESPVRPQHQPISSDTPALAQSAKADFCEDLCVVAAAAAFITAGAGDKSPLFERGRFYDLYSVRRNERLKRKIGDLTVEAVAQDPAVAVELAKRRASKKAESVRKSLPSDLSAGRISSSRSSLRNSKEMKTCYSPVASDTGCAIGGGGRKISTRSIRRL